MQKNKKTLLSYSQRLILLVALLFTVSGVTLAQTWEQPTQDPPAGNVPAPINVGSQQQTKIGTLRSGALTSFNNINLERLCRDEDGQLIFWPPVSGMMSCTTATSPHINFTPGQSTNPFGSGGPGTLQVGRIGYNYLSTEGINTSALDIAGAIRGGVPRFRAVKIWDDLEVVRDIRIFRDLFVTRNTNIGGDLNVEGDTNIFGEFNICDGPNSCQNITEVIGGGGDSLWSPGSGHGGRNIFYNPAPGFENSPFTVAIGWPGHTNSPYTFSVAGRVAAGLFHASSEPIFNSPSNPSYGFTGRPGTGMFSDAPGMLGFSVSNRPIFRITEAISEVGTHYITSINSIAQIDGGLLLLGTLSANGNINLYNRGISHTGSNKRNATLVLGENSLVGRIGFKNVPDTGFITGVYEPMIYSSHSGTDIPGGSSSLILQAGFGQSQSAKNRHIFLRTDDETRLFIHNNGNVGIGTTDPQSRLHARGEIASVSGGNNLRLARVNSDGTTGTGVIHRNDGNHYFILLTKPGDTFGSWADHNDPNFKSLRPFRISLQTHNDTFGNVRIGSVLEIQDQANGGNVGIGVPVPQAKLDVAGDVCYMADGLRRCLSSFGAGGGGSTLWNHETFTAGGNIYREVSTAQTGIDVMTVKIGKDTSPMWTYALRVGGNTHLKGGLEVTEDAIFEKDLSLTGDSTLYVRNIQSTATGQGSFYINDATGSRALQLNSSSVNIYPRRLMIGVNNTEELPGWLQISGTGDQWSYSALSLGTNDTPQNRNNWVFSQRKQTGQRNYLALEYQDGSGDWGRALTVRDNLNIGIGITQPTKRLSVGGGALVTGGLDVGGYMWLGGPMCIGNFDGSCVHEGGGNLQIRRTGSNNAWLRLEGEAGGANIHNYAGMTFANTAANGNFWVMAYNKSSGAFNLRHHEVNAGQSQNVISNSLSVLPNGNVGIGMVTPAAKLDVSGSICYLDGGVRRCLGTDNGNGGVTGSGSLWTLDSETNNIFRDSGVGIGQSLYVGVAENWDAQASILESDLNGDGAVDAVDVQLAINCALGISNPSVPNCSNFSAVEVQRTINAALGIPYIAPDPDNPLESGVSIMTAGDIRSVRDVCAFGNICLSDVAASSGGGDSLWSSSGNNISRMSGSVGIGVNTFGDTDKLRVAGGSLRIDPSDNNVPRMLFTNRDGESTLAISSFGDFSASGGPINTGDALIRTNSSGTKTLRITNTNTGANAKFNLRVDGQVRAEAFCDVNGQNCIGSGQTGGGSASGINIPSWNQAGSPTGGSYFWGGGDGVVQTVNASWGNNASGSCTLNVVNGKPSLTLTARQGNLGPYTQTYEDTSHVAITVPSGIFSIFNDLDGTYRCWVEAYGQAGTSRQWEGLANTTGTSRTLSYRLVFRKDSMSPRVMNLP